MNRTITLTFNGAKRTDSVEPRLLLIHYLREVAGLTGPHIGCETSICGACTVHVDGKAVKSCTMFAVQADGRDVLTIEGLGREWQAGPRAGGLLEPAWPAVRFLHARHDHGLQADPRAQSHAPPTKKSAHGLEGNLCRCTGYQHIVNAVQAAAAKAKRITVMATTITKTETLVGKRIRRREDPRLITGTATYVDDIKMPGMHHACIVRSPHGAARIKSINIKPALELPGRRRGVHRQGHARVGPVPCGASLPGLRVPPHHILATDRVYFVGHPVAVVVATDRYIARDAAEAIEVDYEPLAAVADPEKALAPERAGRASRMARQHGVHITTRKAAMSRRRSPKPRWW